jgi:hypothetical protein
VLQEISDYVNLWLPNEFIATIEMEGPSGSIYTRYEQIQIELILERHFEGLYKIADVIVNHANKIPSLSINIEEPMWYRILLDIIVECLETKTEEPVKDMEQYAREWLTETLKEYNGTVLHYAEKRYEDVSDGSYWRE